MQMSEKKPGYNSALYPSENYTWYMFENNKRKTGFMNEIDINEIKAAHQGVKNKWHRIISKYPDEFKPMLERDKFDWEKIKQLRDSIVDK